MAWQATSYNAQEANRPASWKRMQISRVDLQPSNGSKPAGFPEGSVLVVRGTDAILRLRSLLESFSEQCGQPDAVQDLVYFLGKPGLFKRLPYLFLLTKRRGQRLADLTSDDILGSLLMLEYRILHVGTRAFVTNDRSGRGTLLSRPDDRIRIAAQFCDLLIRSGAKILMLSFAVDDPEAVTRNQPALCRLWKDHELGVQWTLRQRTYPSYLNLATTLEETLATLGQKTRSNMRYYRRRAEKELGCHPVYHASLSERELIRFSEESMYPVSRSTALWRFRTMHSIKDPFLMGMKDSEGRWLSVVAGRRCGRTSEILWQLNRSGFRSHSLGIVMRSYVIEHEIARGSKRLQVEGGTSHTMLHSFVPKEIVDMVVIRSHYKYLLAHRLKRFLLADNPLAQMLRSPDALWRSA